MAPHGLQVLRNYASASHVELDLAGRTFQLPTRLTITGRRVALLNDQLSISHGLHVTGHACVLLSGLSVSAAHGAAITVSGAASLQLAACSITAACGDGIHITALRASPSPAPATAATTTAGPSARAADAGLPTAASQAVPAAQEALTIDACGQQGVSAANGARVELIRRTVEGARAQGIFVQGEATPLELQQSMVMRTQLRSVLETARARARLRRCQLETTQKCSNIEVAGEGSLALVQHCTLTDAGTNGITWICAGGRLEVEDSDLFRSRGGPCLRALDGSTQPCSTIRVRHMHEHAGHGRACGMRTHLHGRG